MELTERDIERFWSKVDKSGECWIWLPPKDKDGYGVLNVGKRGYRAHRIAWFLANGPIPAGLSVCHNCPGGDNPSCVRYNHLFVGSQSENMSDAFKKNPDKWANAGDRNGQKKLTWERVNAIRSAYSGGGVTMRSLAAEYRIALNAVFSIINYKTWRHQPIMEVECLAEISYRKRLYSVMYREE